MKVTILALFTIFFLSFPLVISAENNAETDRSSHFDFNAILVHHLMDAPVVEFNIGGKKVYRGQKGFDDKGIFKNYIFQDERGEYKWDGGIPMHITKRVVMMFIVSALLLSVMIFAANKIKANPLRVNGKFAGIIESMVQFVREEIVNKNMHHGEGFHPFFLTLFFFLLFSNLLGLVPSLGGIVQTVSDIASGHGSGHGHAVPFFESFWPGITVTGDVAVTATFAIFVTAFIWIVGFQRQGFGFLFSCIPSGMSPVVAILLYPILFPLELIVGPLAKGFALAIRLLANMTAGHVMILALLGFIFQFQSIWIAPASIISSGMVYMLELFVAFLQAFIFTLLAAIFIGSSMHKH